MLVDEELTLLRAKTREVEEIGMKIDEALRMCQDNETLIQKLGRFDEEVYN